MGLTVVGSPMRSLRVWPQGHVASVTLYKVLWPMPTQGHQGAGQRSQASACQALGLHEKPLFLFALCSGGKFHVGVLTRHQLWLLPSGLVCLVLVLVRIRSSSDEASKLRNVHLHCKMVQWRRQMAGGWFYSCGLSIKAGLYTRCGPLEKGMANNFSILALRTNEQYEKAKW